MCRFKNWYADEHGYVIQCEDCRHLQVSFGTTMLTMDEKQYKRLVEIICRKMENRHPMHDPNCKCVMLPGHVEAVHIILSENELLRLHHMIRSVDIEMCTKALMDLF